MPVTTALARHDNDPRRRVFVELEPLDKYTNDATFNLVVF